MHAIVIKEYDSYNEKSVVERVYVSEKSIEELLEECFGDRQINLWKNNKLLTVGSRIHETSTTYHDAKNYEVGYKITVRFTSWEVFSGRVVDYWEKSHDSYIEFINFLNNHPEVSKAKFVVVE